MATGTPSLSYLPTWTSISGATWCEPRSDCARDESGLIEPNRGKGHGGTDALPAVLVDRLQGVFS